MTIDAPDVAPLTDLGADQVVPDETLAAGLADLAAASVTGAVPDAAPGGSVRDLRLLADVSMELSVQLGRTRLPLRELLALSPGSVLELDRGAGEPVDVLVNGHLIARGEVVVVDGEFGVRISEIADPRGGS